MSCVSRLKILKSAVQVQRSDDAADLEPRALSKVVMHVRMRTRVLKHTIIHVHMRIGESRNFTRFSTFQ